MRWNEVCSQEWPCSCCCACVLFLVKITVFPPILLQNITYSVCKRRSMFLSCFHRMCSSAVTLNTKAVEKQSAKSGYSSELALEPTLWKRGICGEFSHVCEGSLCVFWLQAVFHRHKGYINYYSKLALDMNASL